MGWREIMYGREEILVEEVEVPDVEEVEVDATGPDSQWAEAPPRIRPTGKANRLAVTALICAFVLPILGIVFGVMALDEISESEDTERGEGTAKWAIGLGVFYLLCGVALIVWLLARH
ncbi:MAG TPA: DUF4190 domain-containing protein [Solirubrobacterales bacterium]|nr:DUF4190 domain-containing protein [Solirubrobacterales bacterium]